MTKNHNFKKKEVASPQSLSGYLKKAREKRGLTLSYIERVSKIRGAFITKMEEGKWDQLPPAVYVKGFLTNYAKLLGLDSKKIVFWYNRERGIAEKLKKLDDPVPLKPLKTPKIIITPRVILVATALLFGGLILGYIVYQFSAFAGVPNLAISEPAPNFLTKESSVSVVGKTDPGADILINDQEIPTSQDGSFRITVGLQPGTNVIKISARNKVGKEKVEEKVVVAEFGSQMASSGEPQGGQEFSITVKAVSKSAFIEIDVDGKHFQRLMMPGTSEQFQAKTNIVLKTGNAGATQVIWNDKDLGKLGNDGEVKKVIIDSAGIKN